MIIYCLRTCCSLSPSSAAGGKVGRSVGGRSRVVKAATEIQSTQLLVRVILWTLYMTYSCNIDMYCGLAITWRYVIAFYVRGQVELAIYTGFIRASGDVRWKRGRGTECIIRAMMNPRLGVSVYSANRCLRRFRRCLVYRVTNSLIRRSMFLS